MLLSKNQITPSPISRKKDRRQTPLDIAWQRACVDSLILTPEEEQEREKRFADIKKRKDEMTKLQEQVKKTDDKIKSMLKDWKNEFENESIKKIYDELVEKPS